MSNLLLKRLAIFMLPLFATIGAGQAAANEASGSADLASFDELFNDDDDDDGDSSSGGGGSGQSGVCGVRG